MEGKLVLKKSLKDAKVKHNHKKMKTQTWKLQTKRKADVTIQTGCKLARVHSCLLSSANLEKHLILEMQFKCCNYQHGNLPPLNFHNINMSLRDTLGNKALKCSVAGLTPSLIHLLYRVYILLKALSKSVINNTQHCAYSQVRNTHYICAYNSLPKKKQTNPKCLIWHLRFILTDV